MTTTTAKDAEKIVELYRAGCSCDKVAEMTGWSSSTVVNVLKRAGVERRPRKGSTYQKLPNADLDQTRFLYEKCMMSVDQVAEELQISFGAALYRLRRAGYKQRSKSEAHILGWKKRKMRG